MTNQSDPSFLDPVSLPVFFKQYWEKQPLYISRKGNPFAHLIDQASIEAVFASRSVYFPGVQLTQSGRTIDVGEYVDTDDRVMPLRLMELHHSGATVVLSQAQKLFAPLNDLCRETLRTLHMRCQANVYLSPPARQGFNPHYDTHDVFILQISGAKTFNFYASSVELPLPEESFDPGKAFGDSADESIRLTAGDTLYIPRGVVHDALADADEPSLHITLGVYPLLMRDVLLARIGALATQDERLRQSIDPNLYSLETSAESLEQSVATLLADIVKPLTQTSALQDTITAYLDELALDAQQDCHGLLTRSPFANDTKPCGDASEHLPHRLRLQHHRILGHQKTLHGVKIRSFGHIVEFSEPVSSVVLHLLQQGYLHRKDWQCLEPLQQEAMIQRLMQDNLVSAEPE